MGSSIKLLQLTTTSLQIFPSEIEKQFKNMKLVMFTILSLAVTASLANPLSPMLNPPGSDSDEYGCIGSAGFSWCEVLGQCVQIWVTPCQKNELELIEEVHELEPLPTMSIDHDALPPCPSCCPYCKHVECRMSHCLANPYPPCEDEDEHCAYWEKQGHCNDGYAAYMKENCKKSCDTCTGTTEYIPTQPGFPIPS